MVREGADIARSSSGIGPVRPNAHNQRTPTSGGATTMELGHYQSAFEPLLYSVGLALTLTLFLRETGPAARRAAS